eukprot:GHVR01008582.1.p1 GENE.GHVR01008582.1~~GHVR01008582.1.p1  ORF type:complete len:198 (-),score=31.58 GHVR01008582.1:148-741(-)
MLSRVGEIETYLDTDNDQPALHGYPFTLSSLRTECKLCNETRINTKKFQIEMDKCLFALVLKQRGIICPALGVLIGVKDKSFTIAIPPLGSTDLVPVDMWNDKIESTVQDAVKQAEAIPVDMWKGNTEPHDRVQIILQEQTVRLSWGDTHTHVYELLDGIPVLIVPAKKKKESLTDLIYYPMSPGHNRYNLLMRKYR